MSLNKTWIAGMAIIIAGGIISWHAYLKETDPKKRRNRIFIGTSISMFGLGVALTAAFMEYKFIKS